MDLPPYTWGDQRTGATRIEVNGTVTIASGGMDNGLGFGQQVSVGSLIASEGAR